MKQQNKNLSQTIPKCCKKVVSGQQKNLIAINSFVKKKNYDNVIKAIN